MADPPGLQGPRITFGIFSSVQVEAAAGTEASIMHSDCRLLWAER